MAEDRQLSFQLADPLSCGAELGGLSGRLAGNLAAVDAVRLEPLMQTAGADAQFVGGLLDLLARTDQRNRECTGTREGKDEARSEPFSVTPSLTTGSGNQTLGQVT